jgi:hypothetical protein
MPHAGLLTPPLPYPHRLGGRSQAGFAASTCLDDELALVVTTQLMPPAAPGGAAESFCTLSLR